MYCRYGALRMRSIAPGDVFSHPAGARYQGSWLGGGGSVLASTLFSLRSVKRSSERNSGCAATATAVTRAQARTARRSRYRMACWSVKRSIEPIYYSAPGAASNWLVSSHPGAGGRGGRGAGGRGGGGGGGEEGGS